VNDPGSQGAGRELLLCLHPFFAEWRKKDIFRKKMDGKRAGKPNSNLNSDMLVFRLNGLS
jgi:hypothetical protein